MDFFHPVHFDTLLGPLTGTIRSIGMHANFVAIRLAQVAHYVGVILAIFFCYFTAMDYQQRRIDLAGLAQRVFFLTIVVAFHVNHLSVVRAVWDTANSMSNQIGSAAMLIPDFSVGDLISAVYKLQDAVVFEFDWWNPDDTQCGMNPFCYLGVLWDSTQASVNQLIFFIMFGVVSFIFSWLMLIAMYGAFVWSSLLFSLVMPFGFLFIPMVLVRQTAPYFRAWLGLFLAPVLALPLITFTVCLYLVALSGYVGISITELLSGLPIEPIPMRFDAEFQLVALFAICFVFLAAIWKAVSLGSQLANSSAGALGNPSVGLPK